MISLKQSYMGKNQVEFNETVKQYRNFVITTLATNNQKITDPGLEIVYNKLNSFFFSKILYGIAALFSLLSLSLLWKRSYYVGISLILVGLIFHTAGLLMRLFIMGHPPVSNLYETFVLTAWILAIIGIILEIIRMRSLGILISSVTGFIFLHVASRYSRDGDTMGMLIAVLDSSFWLTTHIVAISLGYAGFVASGLIAHLYLVARVFSKDNESRLQQISRAVYGLFVFGFIFTVAGTMLGGLWADQAWGRFWGWDPKENGALLIILWGLIVLHSRIAGWIKQNGFAIGAVLSVVTVMCTWIGVNLLGIGLHSYGKTSGGAGVFFSYLGIETAFLIVIGILLNIKKTVPNVVQAKVR
jgi:ABC-type transport system involved in cytochrome c biogenesis permease subunit